MRDKRGHSDFDMSDPQFLMSVMHRHKDWCVVVCLIGGGQEINTGEAGLEEWLAAIEHNYPEWKVHLSDRLTQADYLASKDAPSSLANLIAVQTPELHLAIPVRSFRTEALSAFVGVIINGDAQRARSVHGVGCLIIRW